MNKFNLGPAPANKLRKLIMFSLVCKLGRDSCFRCGKKITNVDQFSIDHKNSWRSDPDPQKAFFALENIAFSHHSCNSAAASRPTKKYKDKKEKTKVDVMRWIERGGRTRSNARRKEKRRLLRESSLACSKAPVSKTGIVG